MRPLINVMLATTVLKEQLQLSQLMEPLVISAQKVIIAYQGAAHLPLAPLEPIDLQPPAKSNKIAPLAM